MEGASNEQKLRHNETSPHKGGRRPKARHCSGTTMPNTVHTKADAGPQHGMYNHYTLSKQQAKSTRRRTPANARHMKDPYKKTPAQHK